MALTRKQLSAAPKTLIIESGFAKPDTQGFAPIYCAEHFFSGPWPCSCRVGPQVLAANSTADEVNTGGARGGTKTHSLLAALSKGNNTNGFDPRTGYPRFRRGISDTDVSYLVNPNYRFLLLIEQASDMDYILERAEQFWSFLKPQINRTYPAKIIFPSGAAGTFGHFGEEGWKKTLGPEYTRIGIDQLEKMPLRETYDRIKASARSKWPEMRTQIISTWNPGGGDDLKGAPGQGWIMDYFCVQAYLDGKLKPWQYVKQDGGSTTHFVFSKVMDNPFFRWKLERVNGVYRQVWTWQCECGRKSVGVEAPERCEGCGKAEAVEEMVGA